jgi:acetyl-CoA acetyltransferase
MSTGIVGIGTVGFLRHSQESAIALASRAVTAALDDAGLERSDIDGLVVHIGSPRGLDYDTAAHLLALKVRFAAQYWSHGRFAATVVQHAAMALQARLADAVLCLAVFRSTAFGGHGTRDFPDFSEALRSAGGPHAEVPAAGLLAPIGGAAMATRRYLDTFGITREKLAAVPLAQREAAALNPLALLRAPVTLEDYEHSPFIVEPLRLLDCSVPVDTAAAVLLVRSDRATSLRQRPAHILSFQGINAGPEEFVFGQRGLGINQASVFDYHPAGEREPVFARSGILPKDISTLHCYDGFSSQVLWTLERFGFCKPGDAADWIQDGRITLAGDLPINTSGGHLSEGHSNGWGHILEIVRQLRGDAGDRQIANCTTALWATTLGDAILFGTNTGA